MASVPSARPSARPLVFLVLVLLCSYSVAWHPSGARFLAVVCGSSVSSSRLATRPPTPARPPVQKEDRNSKSAEMRACWHQSPPKL